MTSAERDVDGSFMKLSSAEAGGFWCFPMRIIPICIQDGDRGGSEEPTKAYWKYVEESDGQHTHLRRVPGRYTLEGKLV